MKNQQNDRKDEFIQIVQTIPYGKPIKEVKMGVNKKGEIIIYGKKKTFHIKDLDAAIRQQLFHVLSYYEDLIINWPKKLIHKGRISQIKKLEQEINEILNDPFLKSFPNQTFTESLKQLDELQKELQQQEKEKVDIVKRVLFRAKMLIEEKKRCQKIIKEGIKRISLLIFQIEYNNEIEWNEYFTVIKKIRSIYANPYQDKTQSALFHKLQYKVFELVKNNNGQKAKELLLMGIKKLVSVYEGQLTFYVGKTKIIVQNKMIRIQEGN